MTGFVNDMQPHAARAELRGHMRSARSWLVFAAVCILLAIGGPFGTLDAMPFALRLGYWVAIASGAFAIGFLVSFCVATVSEAAGLRPVLAVVIGGLSASLPVSLWIAALGWLALGAPLLAGLLNLLPEIAAIAVVVGLLYEMFTHRAEAQEQDRATADALLLGKLPPEIAADIVSLQAQDHYVRVSSPAGSEMVLMPLAAAVSALGDRGLRVHRSWWVARRHARGLVRRNGAPFLVLSDGTEVPVGRTYLSRVRAALDQAPESKTAPRKDAV